MDETYLSYSPITGVNQPTYVKKWPTFPTSLQVSRHAPLSPTMPRCGFTMKDGSMDHVDQHLRVDAGRDLDSGVGELHGFCPTRRIWWGSIAPDLAPDWAPNQLAATGEDLVIKWDEQPSNDMLVIVGDNAMFNLYIWWYEDVYWGDILTCTVYDQQKLRLICD